MSVCAFFVKSHISNVPSCVVASQGGARHKTVCAVKFKFNEGAVVPD